MYLAVIPSIMPSATMRTTTRGTMLRATPRTAPRRYRRAGTAAREPVRRRCRREAEYPPGQEEGGPRLTRGSASRRAAHSGCPLPRRGGDRGSRAERGPVASDRPKSSSFTAPALAASRFPWVRRPMHEAGLLMRARAIAARWRSPPDSLAAHDPSYPEAHVRQEAAAFS